MLRLCTNDERKNTQEENVYLSTPILARLQVGMGAKHFPAIAASDKGVCRHNLYRQCNVHIFLSRGVGGVTENLILRTFVFVFLHV